jgi:hypothetical protein
VSIKIAAVTGNAYAKGAQNLAPARLSKQSTERATRQRRNHSRPVLSKAVRGTPQSIAGQEPHTRICLGEVDKERWRKQREFVEEELKRIAGELNDGANGQGLADVEACYPRSDQLSP